jgi:preprotein translocase subunit SecY
MNQIIDTIQRMFANREVRKKVLFTAAIFLVFRFLAHVPVPAVDVVQLRTFFASNQLLSVLNIFSGGTLSNFSVMAVGINPYITASIIVQLAGMVFPSLKELQKEGEGGREKLNQYTRILAVPIAVVQSISVLALLRSQSLLTSNDPLTIVMMIFTLVAGAMTLMWLGELVSLYGIGNGISMVLFAGIVGQFPIAIAQIFSTTTSSQDYFRIAMFGALFLGVIMLMVFMNEATRKIQIQYAKRIRGGKTYGGQTTHFPIKVNVAGVLPIIFAVSIMLVPSFAGRLLLTSPNTALNTFGQNLNIWFAPTSWVYITVYFLIVFCFTFFSALIFFNAEDISEELKKSGAYIPGIRPGGPTKKFLEFVVIRITLVGALFLGFIAILPSVAQHFTNVSSLAVGGTSMLIVVSVVLETAKQIEGLLVGENYDKYI